MRFSEAWLREWVNPPIRTAELVQQITMAGLEVDAIEPAAGPFSGVVVGRVVEANKHPNADKLSVCMVEDGSTTHQVVCGAPNVRPGLVTAFARVGAVLPGDFKIKKAKLRQVESFGMLCSGAELGIDEDADGIMDLPETLAVGADLRVALALEDQCIEVDLTPNRGDCLSIRGLAREVGVLNQQPVAGVQAAPVTPVHTDIVPVSLTAAAACPRYLGRVIRGVDVTAPTPWWLKDRLRRCGLRSIDPIVDVTNYLLLELGQPMHAFDLAKIRGGINVRFAEDAEALRLLDGRQVELDSRVLVIADDEGAVAMAGVMGGSRTAVSATTTDVFLECAFFSPLAVAGTARRFGLQTDAGHRYERGVDYELQAQAMERATQLLLDIAGGEPGSLVTAVEPASLPEAAAVTLRARRLERVAGIEIPVATVDDILRRLDFVVSARRESDSDGTCWTVSVPSHRFDIAIEADLIEEICRIYGYNEIPSRRPQATLALAAVPKARTPVARLKRQLAGFGYQEVVTYSFIEPGQLHRFEPDAKPMTLANPMSVEQSVMRTTLLPGLVEVWRSNRARQQNRLRVFEVGQCFIPRADGLTQSLRVGGLLVGPRQSENWLNGAANEPVPGAGVAAGGTDFFDLKGDIERLLRWQGVVSASFQRLDTDPALHPGQAASVIVDGRAIGRMGRLHPAIEAELDLGQATFVFELETELLLERTAPTYAAVSRFPAVRRDLALLVDRALPATALESSVRGILKEKLVDFTVFDIYTGKGIDNSKKSVAIGLTIQDVSATLTEAEIAKFEGAVIAELERAHGAVLR